MNTLWSSKLFPNLKEGSERKINLNFCLKNDSLFSSKQALRFFFCYPTRASFEENAEKLEFIASRLIFFHLVSRNYSFMHSLQYYDLCAFDSLFIEYFSLVDVLVMHALPIFITLFLTFIPFFPFISMHCTQTRLHIIAVHDCRKSHDTKNESGRL